MAGHLTLTQDIFLYSPGGDVILIFDLNVKFGSPAYLPAAEAKERSQTLVPSGRTVQC
jgi:hypothetical protein